MLLVITGFLQEDFGNRNEISKKESSFLFENNIANDCNVKFFHLKRQDLRVLDNLLREHVLYNLSVFFTDGISETAQGIYKTYISERKSSVTFLEKLPRVLETC